MLDCAFFDEKDSPLKIDSRLTNLGHIFPNKDVKMPLSMTAFARIDVTATLTNQTIVYFTYGNGLQGSHFEKQPSDSVYYPYVLEHDEVAQKKAKERLKNIDN
ncbi:hypothetical protein LCAUCD174_3140 [Lacticaseibacillus paracasei]|nr:hypothetical protein LCAUCD174_3140 [Lacticaseibacillus paracasei]